MPVVLLPTASESDLWRAKLSRRMTGVAAFYALDQFAMAKLKNDPIDKADLLEYLNSYSDFSFELAVLKMLRERDIECEHGGHYVDPVTKKSREFDIRATKTIGRFRVRMALECKNIRENFPVLISCVPRQIQESYHDVAFVSDVSISPSNFIVLPETPRAKIFTARDQTSLYRSQEPVGKSTAQVGRATDSTISTNDSELYEKWGQCLSSATELVERIYWDGKGKEDAEKEYHSAVFPFVVVPNGRLWTVSYNEDGSRLSDPTPTDRCSCFIGKDYHMRSTLSPVTMTLSHVEIVTFNGMRSFVDTYVTSEYGIEQLFP